MQANVIQACNRVLARELMTVTDCRCGCEITPLTQAQHEKIVRAMLQELVNGYFGKVVQSERSQNA